MGLGRHIGRDLQAMVSDWKIALFSKKLLDIALIVRVYLALKIR
ncbi:unnamed protein product [marine sediment metagenome]|uniref:Uncharacterized protein n=1 Tax=marine sediment metagenome TaxID=412755 RepID=X1R353_9ZZZZ